MWEEQRLVNLIKSRCIQVDDTMLPDYIDYCKALKQQDQEDLNGAYLVDYIIEQRFFPNGRWDSV